jgi:anti-sigma B factor antagonist
MGDPVRMPEDGNFRIDREQAGVDSVVLTLHGEADLHVAADFRDRLATVIDDGASSLVVDLSGVTFVDSMALGVLLGGMKRLRATGGQLRLVVPQTDVRRIFEITMLDRVLAIDSTRDEALAALASSENGS